MLISSSQNIHSMRLYSSIQISLEVLIVSANCGSNSNNYVFIIIAVVSQAYDVKFWEEYVLRGNAAILKCQIPSYVAEYVAVASWIITEDENEKEIRMNSTSDLGTFVLFAYAFYTPIHSQSLSIIVARSSLELVFMIGVIVELMEEI